MYQGSDKQKLSVADLVLTGHTDLAQFALGMSSAEPLVASGGMDTNVSALFTSDPLPFRNLLWHTLIHQAGGSGGSM